MLPHDGDSEKLQFSSFYPYKRKRLSTTTDISLTVLQALKEATQQAPIPALGMVSALALEIAGAAQTARDNREAFQRLAHDSCSLIYHITNVCGELSKSEEEKLSPMLITHLDELKTTLQQICEFVKKRVQRSYWKRYFASSSDITNIQEFRERLRQALDIFGVQSHITVRETMARMSTKQDSFHEELKARDKRPTVEKMSTPFVESPTSTPTSTDNPFKEFLSSANIHGQITFNNVQGDHSNVTNNVCNYSSNTGNTYYSHNDYSYNGSAYGKTGGYW